MNRRMRKGEENRKMRIEKYETYVRMKRVKMTENMDAIKGREE